MLLRVACAVMEANRTAVSPKFYFDGRYKPNPRPVMPLVHHAGWSHARIFSTDGINNEADFLAVITTINLTK